MYAFSVEMRVPFEDALKQLQDSLAANKLGIVSDVDVQAVMKNKLGEDIPPYRILGACAPLLAKRVLEADPEAGALLPCNVIARQINNELTGITFMDPVAILALANSEAIDQVAVEAKRKLEQVGQQLSGGHPINRL